MIDSILLSLQWVINTVGNGISTIIDFISRPLSYLYYFLEGIFYFVSKCFDVVVSIIKIFTAIFQYLGAIGSGLTTSFQQDIAFKPGTIEPTYLPGVTIEGFQSFIDNVWNTGLMTIVPIGLTAMLYMIFFLKVFDLLGHKKGAK